MSDWEVYNTIPKLPQQITPISYTGFQIYNECHLQFGFSKENCKPRKINPRARMGSAFHATIGFLAKYESPSLRGMISFFEQELKKQRADAISNYREKYLPWPKDLREHMENALAVRYTNMPQKKAAGVKCTTETTLLSHDGLLISRPDTVFDTPEGPIVVDYKTGHFDPLKIGGFEDQICFYSGLWEELFRETPKLGRIEFILDEYAHEFLVDIDKSRSMLSNARSIVSKIGKLDWIHSANYGEHCKFCDYRPWCNEYWVFNEEDKDLEGYICEDHIRDSQSFCLHTRSSHIPTINRKHTPIPDWESGTFVRILDLMGDGNTKYLSWYSEMFKVISRL